VTVGLAAAIGIANATPHEITTAPVLIVGSLTNDEIAALSLSDGKPVRHLSQVGFPTARVRTFALTPSGAFAVAPDEKTETFRLVWADGHDLYISPPIEGTPHSGAATSDFVALIVEANQRTLFYRFKRQADRKVVFASEDPIPLERGNWIWRVSPAGILAMSLTNSGRLQTAFWKVATNQETVGTVAAPDFAPPAEWLDLYDAQFSPDASHILISAEYGIDSGGPLDRVDTIIMYDPEKGAVTRHYAFWSADLAEQCPDAVYLVVGDSIARIRGDNGEKCGVRSFGQVSGFHMDAEGNHYFAAESGPTGGSKVRETDGVTQISRFFPLALENIQEIALGKQGQFVWFSSEVGRLGFLGTRLEPIPSGLTGAYDLASGQSWLFDARGAQIFKGVTEACASACGLWSRTVDRIPAHPETPPFSVVGPEWHLVIDEETNLPCLVLVLGNTAQSYSLIDRRGEFPYSPTQEWDYTGIYRTMTYRWPATPEAASKTECAPPPNDEAALNYRSTITGSLQWVGGSEDDRGWLVAILESEGTPFRRLVGLKASEIRRALENARSSRTKEKSASPDIAFSLEGEAFALEPLSEDSFALRRTYTAYPRVCFSRAPVRWTDTYEISPSGVTYKESRVTDENLPDDPCLQKHISATLSLAKAENNPDETTKSEKIDKRRKG